MQEELRKHVAVLVQLVRSEMMQHHGEGRCSFEECGSQSCAAVKYVDRWLVGDAADQQKIGESMGLSGNLIVEGK